MPGIRKRKKLKNPVYQKYVPIDKGDYVPNEVHRRPTTQSIPSHTTTLCDTSRKEPLKYTGENLLGIAVSHKSNLVPIFSKQQAIEVSKMRRN